MSKLSLRQEERLSEEVKKYPVLYNKSHKGYMEKDAVRNAWEEISEKFEFLENGMMFCSVKLYNI